TATRRRANASAGDASRSAPLPARRRGYLCVGLSSAGGGVVRDVSEVDEDAGVVADNLRIVSRRDVDEFAGTDLSLASVVHHDLHPARDAVAEVMGLTRVGAGDRLDVLGPLPARLEDAAEDDSSLHLQHFCMSMSLELPGFIRRVEALGVNCGHCPSFV